MLVIVCITTLECADVLSSPTVADVVWHQPGIPLFNSVPCVFKSRIDRGHSCTPYVLPLTLHPDISPRFQLDPPNNLNCCGVMSPPGVDAQMSRLSSWYSWYSSRCMSKFFWIFYVGGKERIPGVWKRVTAGTNGRSICRHRGNRQE